MTGRRWSLVVLAAAVLTGFIVALAPLISTTSCQSTPEVTRCSSGTASLVAREGVSVLAVLAIPVVVALLPVLRPSRGSALVAAIVLSVAVLLAVASIGIFFIPLVVLAWVAVGAAHPS